MLDAFESAIDAYMNWNEGEAEPTVDVDGKDVPVCDLFADHMRGNQDIMPTSLCRFIANEVLVNHDQPFPKQGATYAMAARRLMPLVKEARNAGM